MIIQLLQSKGFVEDVDFSLDGEILTALDKTRPVEQVIQHDEIAAEHDENGVVTTPAVPAWEETIVVQETYQEVLPSLESLKRELVIANDPAYLIGEYLKTQEAAEPDDSLNLELFLKGGNGWRFANIPAPSVDELFDLIEISSASKSQAEINKVAREFLLNSDWKVHRHRDQLDAGVATSLTDLEFQDLLQQRQAARASVVE